MGEQVWSFQEVQDYMQLRLSDFAGEQRAKEIKQKLLQEILFMALLEDWHREQQRDSKKFPGFLGKKILLKNPGRFKAQPEKLKALKSFKNFLFLKQNLMQFLEQGIPDPSLKEQRAYYQKNPSAFEVPARCQLEQILVKELALANSLAERLKRGESFRELAKRHSLKEELGWVQEGEFPFFEQVCLDEWAWEPLKSSFGYHLFLKTGFKKASKTSFSSSKSQILRLLKQEKLPAEFQKWLKQQTEQKNVWIDKKGLEKIQIRYK